MNRRSFIGLDTAGSSADVSLSPYVPRVDKPWNAWRAGHLLRRAGFGPSHEALRRALASTPAAIVDALLSPGALPSPPGAWTAQLPFPTLTDQARASYRTWLRDLSEWWFSLMTAPAQMLRERMVLFWHNHFVSEFPIVYVTQYMYQQNQLFRELAFGDFRELTRRVTIDPAMLIYLDGNDNRAGRPNENYARELLELFTLGIGTYADGSPHYTERDIIELSRALTGWTVRGLTSEFSASRFDAGAKTIFGSTANFGIAGHAPADVLELIFAQDDPDAGTRRAAVFLCEKLYREFVHAEPASVPGGRDAVVSMATTLVESGWQIAPVLRQLLVSEHFFEDTVIGARIKSPVEFAAGAIASLDLSPAMDRQATTAGRPDTHDPLTALTNLSQGLFFPPSVKGWPGGRTWISSATLPLRIRYARFWVEPLATSLDYGFEPVAFVKSLSNPRDVNQVLDDIIELLVPVVLTADARALLKNELLAGGMEYEWNPDAPNAAARIRACLIRLTGSGEFQLT